MRSLEASFRGTELLPPLTTVLVTCEVDFSKVHHSSDVLEDLRLKLRSPASCSYQGDQLLEISSIVEPSDVGPVLGVVVSLRTTLKSVLLPCIRPQELVKMW